MHTAAAINLPYLAASVFFIVGVKGLSHPRTAVRGNQLAGIGMLIACIAALVHQEAVGLGGIAIGVAIGSIAGVWLAARTEMTSMPQLVAAFNGFGGAASALVAAAAVIEVVAAGGVMSNQFVIASAVSALIGAITLTGSLIAFAKLQQILGRESSAIRGRKVLTVFVAALCIAFGSWMIAQPSVQPMWLLIAAASVLGVLLVIPIGGADMPVVIALLNSYSGLAAAATGFVLGNNVLIIAGSLVGASGAILTSVMCRAMNRSLLGVLFGARVARGEAIDADEVYDGKIKRTSADEVAMLLDGVRRVVVVPGYGMAVAQAQHAIRDLANELGSRGVEVLYAIHPVAGRMPGHMNVLLAEADVPYDALRDLEQINSSFAQVDLTVVIGANDVVNPLARTDEGSPIYGMPVLDVGKSKTVVVIKRSLSPGFAGVPNPLFAADNTLMLFGDGKKMALELVAAVKEM